MGQSNTKGESVKIYTWKTVWDDGVDYNMQVEFQNCGKRKRNKILKSFDGWHLAAQGGNPKKKIDIAIFRRNFKSTHFWKKWMKQSPYQIYKIQKNGTCKLINKGKSE